jgi:tRNA nucleotidyltransferase (CCA-adding enzyme)
LKYDNFQELILNAQNWKQGQFLSLTTESASTFKTPLVFIDPVDNERNVPSALIKENFDLFVKACKEYVKKPRITFFFPNEIKPWSIDKIKKEIGKREFIGLKIEKPEIIAENLYPQVRKAVRSIQELCERFDFTILDTKFHVDNNTIYIILNPEKLKISKTMIHKGPPIRLKENAADFIKKWSNNPRTVSKPFEKDKRLYVEVEREFTNIKDLLTDRIKTLSLGKNIDVIIQKEFSILKLEELLIENLCIFWTEYLDGKMSWER